MAARTIKALLDEQKGYLDYFFQGIDLEKMDVILQEMQLCKGAVVWTGVGKSGIVAQKLAMTFTSIGVPSWHLSAVNALHGDIGALTEKDLCLFISRSGETEELMQMIPFVRKKGAKIIGVASNPKSRLMQVADLSICLPLQRELCPYNLVPTTSTSVQSIFGDILAVALMEGKKVSLQEYAKNHPIGSIGKKLTLLVRDLMLHGDQIPLCSSKDLVLEVLPVLSSKCCGAVLVVDRDSRLLGIFTDGDLRRVIEAYKGAFIEKKIEDVMTQNPIFVSQETLAWDAMKVMEGKKKVMVLPVVDEGKVVGILRLHDILQAGL
ncbi:MAG: KpsF/GutQ family sugar-phosphate isomerase [Chlamydiota bacterium]